MTLSTLIPTTDNQTMGAYVARPATPNNAAMLVIQEIFGVNANLRAIADGYAARGYLAIAPDLFWRLQPGVDLTDQSEAEWQQAFDYFNRFDIALGVADLVAALAFARTQNVKSVGAVGYCLGGKLAYLLAARGTPDAVVGYYGVGIENALDEGAQITCPTLLHIAELDKFVDRAAQETIIDHFIDSAFVTTALYKNVDHAFSRIGGDHYNEEAATLANRRTIDFFTHHLLTA